MALFQVTDYYNNIVDRIVSDHTIIILVLLQLRNHHVHNVINYCQFIANPTQACLW